MEIPRHWRLKKQRYGLVGSVCPHCDYKMFPPREVCPNCSDEEYVAGSVGMISEAAETTEVEAEVTYA